MLGESGPNFHLKLACNDEDGTSGVNFKIGSIFLKVEESQRAPASLHVPTDAPSAEAVPDHPEKIPGLVIVVYTEASVAALNAKVPVLVQIPECAQADYGNVVGDIESLGVFQWADMDRDVDRVVEQPSSGEGLNGQ